MEILRRSFLASPLLAAARQQAHPRLFLDSGGFQALRGAIGATHAEIWKGVRARADQLARTKPPVYHEDHDPEQLWQREAGNAMPFVALAYRLTGDQRYLDSARDRALASCGYPHWGGGRYDGMDLAAGHQLLGLALVYDWLFDDLGDAARDEIQRTLRERGAVMHQAAVSKQYWRNSYLQNHLWVNAVGLAAAGLALPEQAWVELALDKFRRTEKALGPDGASHEGVGYWSYGVEYMLKFWALVNQPLSSPWWRNTAMYRLYLGLPRNSWTRTNTVVDLADCPRQDWYGPSYLLRRLAALYGDPHAQWLAAELERTGFEGSAASWLNLLWGKPELKPAPPSALPTLRHFADMGLVSARSDWSGNESLAVFKCGPPVGHEAATLFDYDAGGGHVHPDVNHFVVFGAGEWLIRDDGYAWKQTSQHNTLLVDGKGQLGEGAMWFRGIEYIKAKAEPRILWARSTPALDDIAGDGAAAYPSALGLKRFVRRLLFMKPDILIVIDDIEADAVRDFELRFHPEKEARLRIDPLTRDGVEVISGPVEAKDREGKTYTRHAVRLTTRRKTWKNAVAISWAAAGAEPPRVTLSVEAGKWVFRSGSRTAEARL